MKLSKLVNVILLPVIACTFSIAGAKLYYDFKSHVSSHLQQDVEFVLKEVGTDINRQHSDVLEFTSQIAESEAMYKYAISSFRPQTGKIESRELYLLNLYLSEELVEEEQADAGIYEILISNTKREELVNLNLDDPFTEFVLSDIVSGTLDNLSQLNDRTEYTDVHYEYYDDYLHMVSGRYFVTTAIGGKVYIRDDDVVWVAQVSNKLDIDDIVEEAFRDGIGQEVSVSVSVSVRDITDAGTTDTTIVSLVTDTNEVVTTMSNSFYDVRVTVPEQYAEDKFNNLLGTVVTLLSITFVICFLVLKRLIHRAIIRPIVELEKSVVNFEGNTTLELMSNRSENEVVALNNSYVELLDKINIMAKVDFLTGLPNRASFQYDISKAVNDHNYTNDVLSILFIDLDNFKYVNDNYGHKVGDDLLRKFSNDLLRLASEQACTKCKHRSCTISVYRLAGDEFAVIISSSSRKRPTLAENFASSIVDLFKNLYVVDFISHDVKASIGISEMTDTRIDPGVLLSNADVAMYDAKLHGKNCYRLFTEELKVLTREKGMIAKGLHEAIDNSSFTLAFMPVYSTDNLSVDGVEVLLRCHEPTLDGFGPDKFIPVAESSGLIKKIDAWVLDNALSHLSDLVNDYGYDKTMSINISTAELRDPEFVVLVSSLLWKYSIKPSQVKLEITETSLVNDDVAAIRILEQLKNIGVQLSLDDFGTGFTAFTQLMNYPVDELKIDRSFVDMIDENAKDKKLTVDIIMDLANIYDLSVTAEGIETQEQIDYLSGINCNKLQGFYLSKPIPYDDFVKLI